MPENEATLNATIPRHEPPWVAGLRAARANFIPGLILQVSMLTVVLAYYFYPPTTIWLNELAKLKAQWGYLYSAVAAIIAGAFLPELLRILVFQKGRTTKDNFRNILYTAPFWCCMSIIVDALYRLQGMWFGNEVTFAVVAKKAFIDQFIYSPFIPSPLTVWFYDFKDHGRHATPPSQFFTYQHFREHILPVVFANWGVWIPVVSILYSLPLLLQMPMYIFALTLWVMIYTWMSEQKSKRLDPLLPPS